jgi:hypothetical protein
MIIRTDINFEKIIDMTHFMYTVEDKTDNQIIIFTIEDILRQDLYKTVLPDLSVDYAKHFARTKYWYTIDVKSYYTITLI